MNMIQDTHTFDTDTDLIAQYNDAGPTYTWGNKKFTLNSSTWTATNVGTIDGVTVTEIQIENVDSPKVQVKANGTRPNTTINFGFLLNGAIQSTTSITVNLVSGWTDKVSLSGIQLDGVEGAILALRQDGTLNVTAS